MSPIEWSIALIGFLATMSAVWLRVEEDRMIYLRKSNRFVYVKTKKRG